MASLKSSVKDMLYFHVKLLCMFRYRNTFTCHSYYDKQSAGGLISIIKIMAERSQFSESVPLCLQL